MAVGGARLGGLQQLQMPPREDLNLPEEGPPESATAGAGAETPPEGTEQEVRAWTSVAGGEKAVARRDIGGQTRRVWLVCVNVVIAASAAVFGPIFKVDTAWAMKWAPPFSLKVSFFNFASCSENIK